LPVFVVAGKLVDDNWNWHSHYYIAAKSQDPSTSNQWYRTILVHHRQGCKISESVCP
jgi:hypothetical protein